MTGKITYPFFILAHPKAESLKTTIFEAEKFDNGATLPYWNTTGTVYMFGDTNGDVYDDLSECIADALNYLNQVYEGRYFDLYPEPQEPRGKDGTRVF